MVVLPNGEQVRGRYPGAAAVVLTEHHLRDELARQLHGATEATLPYGRADVLTESTVFEVEPAKAWRHAVRQVLAYAAQSGKRPAIALFGAADRSDVTRLYLTLRDGTPPIELWWYAGSRWIHVASRRQCTSMPTVDVESLTDPDPDLDGPAVYAERQPDSRAAATEQAMTLEQVDLHA